MPKERILVVEDDQSILELIEYNLHKEGYGVATADNGEKAIELAKRELPQLMILDLMLPGIDGLEVCKIIKSDDKTKYIPIIMLTAKSEETDVVVGLQLGADDYVTKPFSPRVLLARVKTVLRRPSEREKSKIAREIDGLIIDTAKHKISYAGKVLDLTAIEFNILEFLSRYPGRAFSRDQIMDGAWKEGKFVVDRAVDVHIRALRKKLKSGATLIETVHGVGYRFKENEET